MVSEIPDTCFVEAMPVGSGFALPIEDACDDSIRMELCKTADQFDYIVICSNSCLSLAGPIKFDFGEQPTTPTQRKVGLISSARGGHDHFFQ